MKETLKEITHEFDSNYGGLNLRLHTLFNISTELGTISEDVFNTDKTSLTAMGMMLHDIDHKIEILADLLRYTVEDLKEEMEKTRVIKESYFDLLIKNGGENKGVHKYPYYESIEEAIQQQKENTPNSENQG